MKRATLLIAALTLGACGKNAITAEEARGAVQSAEGIQMSTPGTAAGVEAQPGIAYSVAGTPSTYRMHTRNLALAFNGTTASPWASSGWWWPSRRPSARTTPAPGAPGPMPSSRWSGGSA